jgi:SHS2 domain-containing protein
MERFRWSEHVGEVAVQIEAEDESGVFRAAAQALGDLLSEDSAAPEEPFEHREVRADAADRPALLAAWLEELNYLAESEGLVPIDAVAVRPEPGSVCGEVSFHRGEPPHLVKAVTYHRLAFEPRDGGWTATAVLDV